jgi:hypothetical protein
MKRIVICFVTRYLWCIPSLTASQRASGGCMSTRLALLNRREHIIQNIPPSQFVNRATRYQQALSSRINYAFCRHRLMSVALRQAGEGRSVRVPAADVPQ